MRDPLLARHAVGDVQQRARRRDRQAVASDPRDDAVQAVEREIQVGRPHVAPVDHARRQPRPRRQRIEHRVELAGRPDEIDVQLGQRQPRDALQRTLIEALEVRRQADLERRGRAQRREGVGERVELGIRAIEHQAGLVDLNLPGARGRERGEQLRVDRGERRQQRQRLGDALGEQQQRHRAEHDRARVDAELAGLPQVRHPLLRPQREGLAGRQLRDEVVVVGVKPLRHLKRRHALGAPTREKVR